MLDQLEADHKFLVFAHHQSVLNVLQEAVSEVCDTLLSTKGLLRGVYSEIITERGGVPIF